jgi:DNA-binding LytR/AlgR family response regulator
MEKTKILVVEDEILIADTICHFLEGKGYNVFEPVVSFEEAISSIHEDRPDIILLDIQLRGAKSGIQLAVELEKHFLIPFIFLTSNSDSQTLSEAIETNPSAFLTKPFNKDQLFAAIEIASRNKPVSDAERKQIIENIYVNVGNEFIKVVFEDILFLKSDNVYVELHLKDGTRIVTRSTLLKISALLNDDFLRIQRSYIVNTNNVDRVGRNLVTIGSVEIPVGEKFKKKMNKNFKLNANISK